MLDRFLDEDTKRQETGFALCTFQAAVADLVMGRGEEQEEGEEERVLLSLRCGGSVLASSRRGREGPIEEEEEEEFEDAVRGEVDGDDVVEGDREGDGDKA